MTQSEQKAKAKSFITFWKDRGDEKQHTQQFWTSLLQDVYGVTFSERVVEFEKRVKLSHTSYIDAYIAETKVLIEQKGAKIDLHKAYEQSDGQVLTPFQQAKRYADEMPNSLRPRWIVVCNFQEFLIYDLESPNAEPQQIFLKDLEKDFYRLSFLVDQKNENIRREEEISIQAGKLVGKLYDAIYPEYILPESLSLGKRDVSAPPQDDKKLSVGQARSLNILCVRIVFCLYAEDAGLFATRTSFEDYIKSFATENLRDGIIKLFKALDTKIADRDNYDVKLQPFPYVNGGLFRDEDIEIPNFTQAIVDVIVNECAPFDWSEISPTIFGAVFESTLNPETRRKGGMHYTSIANIHKVIDPLFMDDLNAEFEEIVGSATLTNRSSRRALSVVETSVVETSDSSKGSFDKRMKTVAASTNRRKKLSPKERTAALHAFQKKLGSLTFLDLACGSGNFLTETYLSLRRLENKVISILNKGERAFGFDEFIKVHINQFYGIEINDFAVTVAKTALWIAESQMIAETEAIISQTIDFLPLTTNAFIVEGNALRMDWSTLKPKSESAMNEEGLLLFSGFNTELDGSEHYYDYVMGNPPFVGRRYREKEQQKEIAQFFDYKDIDYVACWYYKAAQLISGTKTKCAFVSTNSITQGEQVFALWQPVFEDFKVQIDFAYRTFIWDSESTEKAHVHCVIIGFSCKDSSVALLSVANDGHVERSETSQKFLFDESGNRIVVNSINGYLLDAPSVFINILSKPLCDVPPMKNGNVPLDGDALKIEADDYPKFKDCPWVKQLMGGRELLHNEKRYVLWLVGVAPNEIKANKKVYERVKLCRKNRLSMKDKGTQKLAETPTTFRDTNNPENYIALPMVSSENRLYIPMAYLHGDVIPTNQIQTIPDATLYHFGVLESNVHMAWMRAVAGRLKSDYRYSKDIVYNNFVWCTPSEAQKAKIEQTAQAILAARALFPNANLAELYDENIMPPELRKAHRENDKAVMVAYGFKQGLEESEIVAELFKLYEKLVKGEK